MPSTRERAHVDANLGEHDFCSSSAKPGDLFQPFDLVAKGRQFVLDSSVERSNGFLQLINRPQILQNGKCARTYKPGHHCKAALLGGEAIEQPVAARAAQVGLATTAVRAARGMR